MVLKCRDVQSCNNSDFGVIVTCNVSDSAGSRPSCVFSVCVHGMALGACAGLVRVLGLGHPAPAARGFELAVLLTRGSGACQVRRWGLHAQTPINEEATGRTASTHTRTTMLTISPTCCHVHRNVTDVVSTLKSALLHARHSSRVIHSVHCRHFRRRRHHQRLVRVRTRTCHVRSLGI